MGIQALAQMMMNRPLNFQNVRGKDEEDYRQEIEVVLSPPNPNTAPTPDSMSVARRDPDVRSVKTAAKEAMTKFRSSKTKTKIVIIGGIICFLGAFSGGMGGIVAMKKSVAVDERAFVDDLIDDCPSSAKSAKTCSCSTSEPSSAGKGGKSGSGEPSSSAGKGGKSGSREPSTGKSHKCKSTRSPTVSKMCNCLAIDQMNCHLTTKLLVIKILAASDA